MPLATRPTAVWTGSPRLRIAAVVLAITTAAFTALWIVGPTWWTSAVAGSLAPVHVALIAYVIALLAFALGYVLNGDRHVWSTSTIPAHDEGVSVADGLYGGRVEDDEDEHARRVSLSTVF